MPQFLIHPSAIKNNTAIITGGDARHITTVLRLKLGDWLMLTDGLGHCWRAEITSASPKKVEAKLKSPLHPPFLKGGMGGLAPIALAQALIKHDRFEWIIQKAVELGCTRIIPFVSERTVPKYVVRRSSLVVRNPSPYPSPLWGEGKIARWQTIADEAAKQCGTVIRPVIEPPVDWVGLIKRFKELGQVIMFYEGEGSLVVSHLLPLAPSPLPSPSPARQRSSGGRGEGEEGGERTTNPEPRTTTLIIGPEGGFTADEVRTAKEAGAITCSLGPLILRVETAAIAALTLVQYKMGWFDKTPIINNQ